MRYGVLGTGTVGQVLAGRLVEVGHEVRMGSRTADNEAAAMWAAEAGPGASHGTFADAAEFGQTVMPCILVVGDREAEAETVSVRRRGKGDLGAQPLTDLREALLAEAAARTSD